MAKGLWLRAIGLAVLLNATLPASASAAPNALLEAMDAAAAKRRAAAASQTSEASPPPTEVASTPAITIIIDDLGYHPRIAKQLLALPEQVTLAILPHTPSGAALAQQALHSGHEIMLHLPMESSIGMDPGPGTLSARMSADQFSRTVRNNLDAIPNIVGVNNHMGSLLTSRRDAMDLVMRELADRGSLFFVDSRTSVITVAEDRAREFGIPSTRRDVFLDNERNHAAIDARFDELLEKASQRGHAVAIGHPYPETLAVLQRRLPSLKGYRVIRVSEQIAERNYKLVKRQNKP